MQSYKIPDWLNNFLIVVAILVCLQSVLRIRNGGGPAWFVILGASGYFLIAGLYQKFFR